MKPAAWNAVLAADGLYAAIAFARAFSDGSIHFGYICSRPSADVAGA